MTAGFSALAMASGAYFAVPRALAALRRRRADIHVLVLMAMAGAAWLGEWLEGAMLGGLFALAQRLEAWSLDRAREAIGTRIEAAPSDSSEPFVESFARLYTPAVMLVAALVAVLPPLWLGDHARWLHRGMLVLLMACPCALVMATPVSLAAALASGARRGICLRHARRTQGVIRANVALALAAKAVYLLLVAFGLASLWMAVAADLGATLLVTFNGLRLLRG